METSEMWCYKQMQRINWIDGIPDERVLLQISKKKELIIITNAQKLQ